VAKKRKATDASLIREHLLKALEFLTRSRPVGTYAKDLLRSCVTAQPLLQRSKENSWSLTMAPWTFELSGVRYRGQEDCIKIVMGAEIRTHGGRLLQQTVPICVVARPRCFSHGPPWCKQPAGQDGEAATRRLHFDYDADVTKWPKHHLQVGGNPQELRRAGSYYYAVAEDPSEPRVPAPALDFVLALDLVMRQFDTGLDLPQEPGWRKLVIRSEELCLKPYFEVAHFELGRSNREVPLIEHLSQ
jgi:hypothetical protein